MKTYSMKLKIAFIWAMFLGPIWVVAQDPFEYNFELIHVDYSVEDYNREANMWNDAGEGLYDPEYRKDGSVYISDPKAFVSGESPRAQVYLDLQCPFAEIYLRGIHNDFVFPAKLITAFGDGNVSYNAEKALEYEGGPEYIFPPNVVNYFENFEVDWQWCKGDCSENSPNWTDLHTSNNTVYIVKDVPEQSSETIKFLHTYYKISCMAAQYETDKDAIINEVWKEFLLPSSIYRADDGVALTYYGDWSTLTYLGDDLVIEGDGQCSSYSQVFLNCLKVHGIQDDDDFVIVRPEINGTSQNIGVLIESYIYDDDGYDPLGGQTPVPNVPHSSFDKVIIPKQGDDIPPLPWGGTANPLWFQHSTFDANVHYSDFDDDDGYAAQHVDNPKSVFLNHQFVKLDVDGQTKYYDVPYGTIYTGDIQQMKANIYAWFFRTTAIINEQMFGPPGNVGMVDLNGDGDYTTDAAVEVWMVSTDMSAATLVEEVSNEYFKITNNEK